MVSELASWDAKYKNDRGEYEVNFYSREYAEAKAVERVCRAIIDKQVKGPEDVPVHRSGPKTMADRIRNMTYTELFRLFWGFHARSGCPDVPEAWCASFTGENSCEHCIRAWLEQEVELGEKQGGKK